MRVNMPTISVIVPVYNVEKYLARCISSILAQTFTDFELILVDDGSPDNCGEICDKYAQLDSRIIIIHQHNGGLSSARNVGLELSLYNKNSEWITFIDSDDWIHKEYLTALFRAAVENKLKISSLFLTSVVSTKEAENYNNCQFRISVEDVDDVYISFGKQVACYAPGRLYFKSLWNTIRFPIGKVWEDVVTTYKVLFQVKKIALVHEDLYYYFVNLDGISEGQWKIQNLDELEAYEIQLKDKRIIRNKKIYTMLKNQYIDRIDNQLRILKRSQINEALKLQGKRILIKKLRLALLKYSKDTEYDFKLHNKLEIYNKAFPIEMKPYWYSLALKKKLKRLFKME